VIDALFRSARGNGWERPWQAPSRRRPRWS